MTPEEQAQQQQLMELITDLSRENNDLKKQIDVLHQAYAPMVSTRDSQIAALQLQVQQLQLQLNPPQPVVLGSASATMGAQ